jgi:hypothetical protein
MITFLILFFNIFFFFFGKLAGKLEATLALRGEVTKIITATQKVQNLANLKGEDISKISDQEFIERIKVQLNNMEVK